MSYLDLGIVSNKIASPLHGTRQYLEGKVFIMAIVLHLSKCRGVTRNDRVNWHKM